MTDELAGEKKWRFAMIELLDLKTKNRHDISHFRLFNAWTTWVIAILIVVLMASTLFNILRKPETLQFIGEHLSQIYYGAKVITAANCFIYGIVIIVLRLRAVASERW